MYDEACPAYRLSYITVMRECGASARSTTLSCFREHGSVGYISPVHTGSPSCVRYQSKFRLNVRSESTRRLHRSIRLYSLRYTYETMKLFYFDMRGRGEVPRIMLRVAGNQPCHHHVLQQCPTLTGNVHALFSSSIPSVWYLALQVAFGASSWSWSGPIVSLRYP